MVWVVDFIPLLLGFSLREQSANEVWFTALSLLADEALPLYWRLSYGAVFWWTPGRSELLPTGFATQPFAYEEVTSVTLFDAFRFGKEVITCDLPSMAVRLGAVAGLLVTELQDVSCPPIKPPSRALQLTLR